MDLKISVHISLDCPHCLATHAGFSINQNSYVLNSQAKQNYTVLAQCGVCKEGVLVKYKGMYFTQWLAGQYVDTPIQLEVWPKIEKTNAPDGVPDNVEKFYLQAMDNLKRRNFDAAGTMFRKSLDTGLRALHPEGKGTLQNRIDKLPDNLGVTSSMKIWAHEIRFLGNDAAHEDEPFSEADVTALQGFTELFLTYTFTLPKMLNDRKSVEAGVTA